MAENNSEVARLLTSIRAAYEGARQGLSGLASGTARHSFINAKLERVSELHDSLCALVGEQAMPLIVQALETLPDAQKPAGEGSATSSQKEGKSDEQR